MGTWTAEGVIAGTYALTVTLEEAAADGGGKVHFEAKTSFTVPGDASDGALQLAEIKLHAVQ